MKATHTRGSYLIPIFVGFMVLLGIAYFAVPTQQAGIAAAAAAASAGAIVAGVHRNRPRRAGPWLLFAAAVILTGIARLVYAQMPGEIGSMKDGLVVLHVLYLAIFGFLIGGLLGLARQRAGRRDFAALIDAAILVLGAGLLSWIFIVEPLAVRFAGGGVTKPVSMLFPLFDVVLLAAAVRLLTAVRRSASATLLGLSLAVLLVNNQAFWIANIRGPWLWGTAIDAGWLAYFMLLGCAALHPSMPRVMAPITARLRDASNFRLALLALASLVPPVILVVETGRDATAHRLGVVIVSVVMLLLVLARLAWVAYRLRQQSAREHDLREATAELIGAADVAEVEASLDAAVRRILPAGRTYRLVLATPDDGWSGLAAKGTPSAGLVPTSTLPQAILARLGTAQRALAYPLVKDAGEGTSTTGLLIVGADEGSLATLRVPLGTLAASATLALERIRLGSEVIRTASEQYFRALVQNASDVILVLDDDDRVRYASPSAAGLFGNRRLPGMPLAHLIEDRDRVLQLLELSDRGTRPTGCAPWSQNPDWTVRGDTGPRALVEVSCRDLRDDPSIRGRVLTLRDVTEQRRLQAELTRQAFHDPLTGLPNRVLFGQRLQEAIDSQARDGTVSGVMLVDLDEFKMINDALGHESGDAYLITVGQRLLDVVSPHGLAARLGGDEFAAVILNAPDIEAVDAVAGEIVRILGEPVRLGGQFVACGASVGVATTVDASSSQELMHHADLSLYSAKEAGKGRWRHYEHAMHTTIRRRLELRSALEHAINDDAFVIEYQPIVTLADGEIVGCEALLRWRHPTRGPLTPGEFIDAAEQSGLIVPIGSWVLATAIGAAARWRSIAPDHAPYVSVNVSARQFETPGFVDQLRDQLAASGLPPALLMLEITESLLLREDDRVWEELHQLRAMGVSVAIDDFGTGYSALSYLRQVPLDVIKIDRLFTASIASSPQQRAVFEGIVNLALTLGLAVVAEGIETPTERELADRAGCAYGQGFLFARPMPDEDLRRRLASRGALPV